MKNMTKIDEIRKDLLSKYSDAESQKAITKACGTLEDYAFVENKVSESTLVTVQDKIQAIQDTLLNAYELSGGDMDTLTDIISDEVYQLTALLGVNEEENSVGSIKEQLNDLRAYHDSMFTGDPNYIPRFTSGEPIRPQDMADYSINMLDNIAEALGIELED
ncbi:MULTISPECIES: hypothetical protein [unclassified Lactococcus]|uniref:hypothetical protein n=1 Tax=unclassified Lactococcus TaxID=2643510 RepID=UPI0011CBBEA4|nr:MULTISPECIES: hypothetical protein [unclassified Lactococcus]MQW23953.1 hypothetical protein [Lactococcus sp. dk101]TXK36984.1 hypothetical protein FVP42_10235 [Lactococcus sp. dk310]TXK47609.1 hypothetical protein FVP43_09940 [Lactococcus sp. dk322]